MREWPAVENKENLVDFAKEIQREREQDISELNALTGRVYGGVLSFETVLATGNIGSKEVTYLDCTAGNITATLPNPTTNAGKTFTTKRTDGSANTVTVNANGGGTFDGGANYTLAANKSKTLHSNGVEYKITGAF